MAHPTANCRNCFERAKTFVPNEPTQFKISQSIVYADADGKTLDAPGLTKDQKVRVHYMKTAGENVADRVTLIKE